MKIGVERTEITGKDGARLPAPQQTINFNKFDNVTIAKELEIAEANGVDKILIKEVRELAALLFEKKATE